MKALEKTREHLAAYDEAALSLAERVDREHLLTVIDHDLFWVKVAEWPFVHPSYYLYALSPSLYVARPYDTPERRLQSFVTYANSVVKAVPEIRRNLRTPMPLTSVKVGIAGFGGLARFYREDVPLAFKEVQDPKLQAALAAASAPAAQAMDGLAAWLKEQEPHAVAPLPLGAERYTQMLHMTERMDLTVEEVERLGVADLQRNSALLAAACRELDANATTAECARRVRAQKPPGGCAVAEAREQLKLLRRFVAEKDLVTIPGTEKALVEEAPPFNRQNFAYIDTPGPFEKGMPSTYYITPPDPSWPLEEQQGYLPSKFALLFTSAHEVWPGHFLQFLHANRAESKAGRVFVGYAYAEGWAHYAEEMMWEQGFGGTPEVHIGQLLQALLRDCRLLASVGLHTKGWTLAESERCFRERAFADEASVHMQAARGTWDPSYLHYTLGKLMVMQLRKDWLAAQGEKGSLKAFHDKFLSFGGPPISTVRKAMLGGI